MESKRDFLRPGRFKTLVFIMFGVILLFELIGLGFLVRSYLSAWKHSAYFNVHVLWIFISLSVLTCCLGIAFVLFYRRYRQPELEAKVQSIHEDILSLNGILNGSPDIIAAFHKDGNLFYWNRKAETVFQKKASDMLGRNLFDKAEFFRKYRQHCDFVRTHHEEVWMLDEKMTHAGFEKSWSMVIYPAGSGNLVIQMTDITDSLQIMRRESNYGKMDILEGMMNGFQHRFNNYLSGIMGYTDLLMHDSPGPEILSHKENIGRIVYKFKDQVGLLRAFSPAKVDSEVGIIDIVDTVNGALKMLCDMVPENLNVSESVQTHGTKVLGSAYMLDKAFVGLLRYILRLLAHDPDGHPRELKIEFKTMMGSSVSRNKGGIVPVAEGDLKQEFLRVDIKKLTQIEESQLVNDIFRPFDGTGTDQSLFDLTIAYHIIKKHQGDIYSDGDALVVLIPRMRDMKEIHPEEKVQPLTGSGQSDRKKVLIVEDDPEMRKIMTMFLAPLSYEVTLAGSSAECIRISRENPFDLVILDLILPDARGDVCLDEIKRRNPETAFILSTGYPDVDTLNDLKARYPGVVFLSKPYALKELVATMNNVLKTTAGKVP